MPCWGQLLKIAPFPSRVNLLVMNSASRLSKRISLPLLLLSILTSLMPQLGSAQTPSSNSLDTDLLQPDSLHRTGGIITDNTISATEMTLPSFWWAKEQFNEVGGKLINKWTAYPDEKRLDLIVNRQAWSLLDYLGRYRFINKFGAVARDNNYNVRVLNQQGEPLGTYTCNYSQSPANCEIKIHDSSGRTSLPVSRPSLGEE